MGRMKMRYALDEPGAPVKIARFAQYLETTALDFSAYFPAGPIRRYTALGAGVRKMGYAFQEGYMNLILLYGFLRDGIPRYEDACRFQGSPEGLASAEPAQLPDLLWMSASLALVKGIVGLREFDAEFGFEGVKEYLALRELAEAKGWSDAVPALAGQCRLNTEFVTEEMRGYLDELAVSIRLRAIQDPIERNRELVKEIGKNWPPGLSAADAIQEQRARDWNPVS